MKESAHQIQFCDWLNTFHKTLLYWHTPNGEKRTIVSAVKLKKMGVKKGVPDLFFPTLRLFIEMKRSDKETLTNEQKNIKKILIDNGYQYIEGYGFPDTVKKFNEYLEKL